MKQIFIKNSITALTLEIIVFIFGFFVPRFIIQIYGSEIHGLSSSILQILSLIQLIQAGSIGASIFALFKPIQENDDFNIAKIYHASCKYFAKTSKLYMLISILTAVFSPLVIKVESVSYFEIVLSFLVFVFIGFVQFYYISRYDTLLSSHQQRYILTLGNIIEKVIYYLLLFLVLYLQLFYILMYVVMLIGIIIKSIYLSKIVNKKFGHIIYMSKEIDSDFSIPNKNDVMITSIILNIISAFPVILITIIWGLEYVSIYGIYAMIGGVILMLFNVISYSSSEILGSSIIKLNEKETIKMFDDYSYIYFILLVLIVIPSFQLISPFVNIYIGSESKLNYIYPLLGFTTILNIVFYMIFLVFRSFIQSFGLFYFQKKAIIISMIVSLPFFIGLTLYRFDFIYFGSIVFYLMYSILSARIIIRRKLNYSKFMKKPLIYSIITMIIMITLGILFYFKEVEIVSLSDWIKFGVIMELLLLLFISTYSFIFERNKIMKLIQIVKKKITK